MIKGWTIGGVEMKEKMARIRDGAMVGQDHGFHKWIDSGEIFNVKDFSPERKKLTRDGYGNLEKSNCYGNGALFVKIADLIEVGENKLTPGGEMTEKAKIMKFLRDNGWESEKNDSEFIHFYHKNAVGIDISDTEIVFIDDTGDFAHIPLNYYALVGFVYVNRIIPINL